MPSAAASSRRSSRAAARVAPSSVESSSARSAATAAAAATAAMAKEGLVCVPVRAGPCRFVLPRALRCVGVKFRTERGNADTHRLSTRQRGTCAAGT
eukprot:651813-Prymnesium_polylepis.1